VSRFVAGLDGVTFESQGSLLLGGFYRAAGETPRPTAVLLHGLPGIEKHLDVAYQLRDVGWNCLYFHPRGSWGSQGSFAIAGQLDDVAAALDWACAQPSVDRQRLALIGGSTGGWVVLQHAARDRRVGAVAALCPFIDPLAFTFPPAMANEFAAMLRGATGADLLAQWSRLDPLLPLAGSLAGRALLIVSGDRDELCPPAHYQPFAAALPGLRWERHPEADHAFSEQRPWLVRTVTEFLASARAAHGSSSPAASSASV
jgi:pimeloyl-ACP methyl ester carboxylesterase